MQDFQPRVGQMEQRLFLEPGMLLDRGYKIIRVVGAGGFGVTYEAEDVNLCTKVAIKEYFPHDMAMRRENATVQPISERHLRDFNWGRSRFLEEARALAQFKHPSIVEVYRYFEANDTVYMTMKFESGQSMESWLRTLGRPPTQSELDRIVLPLVDALEVMHDNGLLHRDVAPDNIIVRENGTPVLLDFGSARRTLAAKTHALTGMFKQGYSPQEQYATDGKFQGPWSDLYAMGATLYRAVTGAPPEEATSRVLHDSLVSAVSAAQGDYRSSFLDAIDKCLKMYPSDRPQSAREFRALLAGQQPLGHTKPVPTQLVSSHAEAGKRTVLIQSGAPTPSNRRPLYWATAASLGLCLAVAVIYAAGKPKANPTSVIEPVARAVLPAPENPHIASCLQSRLPGTGAKDAPSAGEVVATCSRALDASPDHPVLKRNLAIALLSIDQNSQRATTLLRNAVEQNDPEAIAELGYLYEKGLGLEQDFLHARSLYVRAASAGSAAAQNRLGVMYELGRGVERDYATAHRWYETAVVGGSAQAMTNLGTIYENGLGVPVDFSKARTWYERGAAAGDPSSSNYIGILFETGRGVSQDLGQARLWYERAAAQGEAAAMRNLGQFFENGRGVNRDLTKARSWYEKSAAAGEAAAMSNLGLLYEGGRGVARDYAKAREWYESGVAGGEKSSMTNLGRFYEQGLGTARDMSKALALYEKAAALGDAPAMYNLGVLYENGRGIPRNLSESRRWYEKAAEAGDVDAMRNLASIYQHGRGVAPNSELSRNWSAKAARAAAAAQ